jgi:hypothetical protein
MRHITLISNLILLAGAIVAAIGIALDLSPVVTLIGLMMAIAGIVKIVTVRIWAGFFVDEEGAQR